MDAMIENMRSTFGSGVRKMFSNNNQTSKNNALATSDDQQNKMSLTSICDREGSTVPFIVRDICKFISKQALLLEGIFRVNASARVLNELRDLYESNTNYDQDLLLNRDEVTDIVGHAAAGLLKKFMRQLTEPLIHDDVLRIYLDSKTLSDQVFCDKIKLCMSEWPVVHRDTLLYLLTFLHTVAQESKNRMSVNGLAVVFGPNVFKLPEGPEAIRTQTIANHAFERLLSCSYLLSDRPMTPKKSAPTPAARPSPPARRSLPVKSQEQIIPTVTVSPTQIDPTPTNNLPKPVPAVRRSKFAKAKTEPIYDVVADDLPSPNGFRNTLNSELLDTTTSPFTSPAATYELDLKSLNHDDLSSSRSKSLDSSEIPELVFDEDGSMDDSLNSSGNITRDLKFADDNTAILEDSIRAIVRTRLFNSTESSSVSDDAERSGLLSSTAANRDRGPKNRRKPTRANRLGLLNNVHFDDSDGDETIATPTNSDITTARSAAMDSVITVLTPKVIDDNHTSNSISKSMTSPAHTGMTSSVTVVTTPDSGCVVDEFSAIKTELSASNANRGPVVVPKLNLRSSLDEDDLMQENEATPLNGDSVPQLDLSSVTESVDREVVKPQKRTSHTVASSPQITKPVAEKKKKKRGQVIKKTNKVSSESSPQPQRRSDNVYEETLEDVREKIAQALRDNRRIAGRPYDIIKMAFEDLKEEKLSMQRELLKYEARYGRPSTKEEKQIMREIYDRYRAVKRLLVANDKKEFDENENTFKSELNGSFLLTRPLGNDLTSCDESDVTHDEILNTPTADLLSRLRELQGKRKRLRRILREFESKRAEEKLERRIMRSEYDEYKHVKSKIRDLESTLTKKGIQIF